MTAEVDYPKGDKSPEVRVWFEGVPCEKPFKLTELAVWQLRFHQFVDGVKEEAAKLANPANQPKPKPKKRKK